MDQNIWRRWDTAVHWLSGWLPMTRRAHVAVIRWQEDMHRKQLDQQSEIHRTEADRQVTSARTHLLKEIEETEKRVDGIIAKCADLQWDRPFSDSCYQLTVMLDPRAFGGMGGRDDELRFMAKMLARQVEAEVASSKFVTKAHETMRGRERPLMRPNSRRME
jgi:hypothetical protein